MALFGETNFHSSAALNHTSQKITSANSQGHFSRAESFTEIFDFKTAQIHHSKFAKEFGRRTQREKTPVPSKSKSLVKPRRCLDILKESFAEDYLVRCRKLTGRRSNEFFWSDTA